MQILGKEYKVELVEDDSIIRDYNGACEHEKCLINIVKTLGEDKKIEVLLHEAIHILSGELAIGLKENQVKRLAVGLYAMLKENGIVLGFEELLITN